MSVYKPKNSPYYHFDFQVAGARFHGSTGKTNKREGEAVERTERENAKAAVKSSRASKGGPLTIDDAAERYWLEVGKDHANDETTATELERLVRYFGPTILLVAITDDDVAELVRWRRHQHRWGKPTRKDGSPMPLVTAATVNRSTTLVLKKLFTRARKAWKHTFPDEPNWSAHWLAEPKEIVRELRKDERASLDLATRNDYAPLFAFEKATGVRLKECLIRWSDVDFDAGFIHRPGKGGRLVKTAITPTVRDILLPLVEHDKEWVFTYEAARTVKGNKKVEGRIRGKRYPITYEGLKSQWKRIRSLAGVEGFRFHDFRHDLGTKLLRMTGSLKTVQKALGHTDIKTTTRYAHVLDEEVAADLERLAKSQRPDKKSRPKSRKTGTEKA